LISNEFGNAIAIDDEHKSPTDQPMPMTLESTDPMHTDSHEMVFFYVLKLYLNISFMLNIFRCLICHLVLVRRKLRWRILMER
jgi:hypothetical protein